MAEPSDEVITLAARGRKIDAIKLLREQEGLGLAEAKQIVDGIDVDMPSTTSGGREESSTGRLLLILVVLFAGLGAFYFLTGGV